MTDTIIKCLQGVNQGERNPRPHKILMILTVLELFRTGKVRENRICYDNDLIAVFGGLFRAVASGNDRNRPYTPFFHLRSNAFWRLIAKPGRETDLLEASSVGGPSELMELVDHVELAQEFYEAFSNSEDNLAIQNVLKARLMGATRREETDGGIRMNTTDGNVFVRYLNTLHSGDANNKGALAEAQAKEPLFAELQVPHPWADEIFGRLTGADNRHVILSGHAGDGKSTIAIEILRQLHGLPTGAPLPNGLQKMETVEHHGVRVTVIKDLSECTPSERIEIFDSMMSGSVRYLIISNTGTLLDFFKARAMTLHKSEVEIEDLVLTALDSTVCRTLELGAVFSVYNLAQCDNVSLALKLLDKLVSSSKWDACSSCRYARGCPILANRTLILGHLNLVLDRIGLLYYRAYAYGERLTMRQVSAHFAYMVTAGLDCSKVAGLAENAALKPDGAYSFIHRFWGDDGFAIDASSRQMKAIRVFAAQPLNEKFAPSLERRFWEEIDKSFDLGIPEVAVEAAGMLKKSKRTGDASVLKRAAYARRNWRRYMYFLYEPSSHDEALTIEFSKFLAAFLGSPMAVRFRDWQRDPQSFSAKTLQSALFAVLQEEFCGYRPVDGGAHAGDLYVTLRQKSAAIVQSAQLILRKVSFSDAFVVKMHGTPVKLPTLIGIDELEGVTLTLDLPFLDYMMLRRTGEMSRGLSVSYRTRLEKLMAQIVAAKKGRQSDFLQILKKGEDGELKVVRIRLTEDAKNLEVL